MEDSRSFAEKVADARARGVDPARIAAAEASHTWLQTWSAAASRVSAAEQALQALNTQKQNLAEEAVRHDQDATAARRRAQRHLDAASAEVAPYERAQTACASQRAEVEERIAATERELAEARAAETEMFTHRPGTAA